MDITFLHLRKKPGKLLEALERREQITISRRGKTIASVLPIDDRKGASAAEHPAFGMWADYAAMEDVAKKVREMRKGRFDAF